jgi:putative ABC transport system ATP-binding protein
VTIGEFRAEGVDVSVEGAPLLHGVELLARSGEWTTIVGPSGSGKSLLLLALAGLHPLENGSVLVDGQPAWTGPHRQSTPGIVLQDDPLVPYLTALEMVALPLQVQGVTKADIRRRSEEWLDRLGLSGAAHQLVTDLSGGQRQRLAIARTLAMASPLLFLDEPTSELDAANRQLVLTLLQEATQRGCVLIVVSHDPAILEVSDQVLNLTANGALEARTNLRP